MTRLGLDLGNEAFRIKLEDSFFISLKSSALLNNVIIHSKLKKTPAFKSHSNIILPILPTIYQHFSVLKPKSFCFIKYFENAKNFVVI